jgi:hypothetical protein
MFSDEGQAIQLAEQGPRRHQIYTFNSIAVPDANRRKNGFRFLTAPTA